MTAARQERKSRRCRAVLRGSCWRVVAGRWSGLDRRSAPPPPSGWSSTATPGWPSTASIRSPISSMPRRRSGRAELELRYGGAIWRFRNEGNRAAFAADPDIYMPRFGGYDPVAVARGAATPGHPELWLIAEQRLYLFYSAEARDGLRRRSRSARSKPPSGTGRKCSARWCRDQRRSPRASPQAMKPGTRKSPLSVAQRLPSGVRHRAAGRDQHGVAGRDVPFGGRRRAADRGRPRLPRAGRTSAPSRRRSVAGSGSAIEIGVGRGIEMRAADQRRARRSPAARGCGSRRARARRPARRRAQAQPLGAVADVAAPDQAERRRRDHAGDRRAVSISAMLTVNSSRPARNSRVPSSGSTRMKRSPSRCGRAGCRRLSSDTTGTPGSSRASPARMTASDGLVGGGDRRAVGLVAPVQVRRGTARIAAAAREAISVRPSSSRASTISGFRRHDSPRLAPLRAAIYHIAALTLDARIA